ncbi:uncharacterized protein LOC111024740 [Momordica charantia]|uniref:Uncharacterized protein LOC111024740 n=1 Tax=Momordica charantia TaxID=3673 RepID=A0A6J1DVF6_MOMCH|nr:uncharacterized protein LOC111024740 [Momordica charantia]
MLCVFGEGLCEVQSVHITCYVFGEGLREPSSSGVRDQVSRISAASLDRCLRRASKFVSDPGSVLQRTIDYAAEAFVASIQSALAVKAELDGREVLAAREKEEFSAALEAAPYTMKDELLKAHSEVETLKAEVESQAELLKKEEDRRKAQLRAAHAITRGLEREKFQLLKEKDDMLQALEVKDKELEHATAELETAKERLSNEIDLSGLKRRYAEKWASGPGGTPGPQALVDQYVRDLDSDYSDPQEDQVGSTQEGAPPAGS